MKGRLDSYEKASFSLVLAIVFLIVSSPSILAAERDSKAEVPIDSETLIAQAEEILQCKNGEFPKELSLEEFCGALMEVDPELVEKVYEHIESIASPAEIDEISQENSAVVATEPRRNGVYVRDGDGGYFIYDEFDMQNDSSLPEDLAENENMGIEPYNSADYDTVSNPQNSRMTNSVCKIFAIREGRILQASGFFVGNTVVATAAHTLYRNSWDEFGLGPSGWADEVYIYQAYIPGNPPYGRVYADCKQMRVGASWKTSYADDDDWGVFVVKKAIQGRYPYLPKKQIDANTYVGNRITFYGYPHLKTDTNDVDRPMFAIKGKTVVPPSGLGTYRTLYSRGTAGDDSSNFSGVSGGPVLDSYGYIIGINIARKEDVSPKYSRAIAFDSYLYQALKAYE